jgi:hypothetical protein
MTVYVDELRGYDESQIKAPARRYGQQWAHLTAESEAELHAFAARLGLRRAWYQPGSQRDGYNWYLSHYDLTPNKRALAVRLGATEVRIRDQAERFRAEREAQARQRRGEVA